MYLEIFKKKGILKETNKTVEVEYSCMARKEEGKTRLERRAWAKVCRVFLVDSMKGS